MEKGQLSFSLDGGDTIVANLLPDVESGTYIDVGSNDPIVISNTYYFYRKGWNGLAIDANHQFEKSWKHSRPRDKFVASLVSDTENSEKFT